MSAITDKQAASTDSVWYVEPFSRRQNRLPSGGWFALNCQGFLVTGQGGAFAIFDGQGNPLVAGTPAVLNGSIKTSYIKTGTIVVSCYLPPLLSEKNASEAYNNTNL
jgi:hypothetical protein